MYFPIYYTQKAMTVYNTLGIPRIRYYVFIFLQLIETLIKKNNATIKISRVIKNSL